VLRKSMKKFQLPNPLEHQRRIEVLRAFGNKYATPGRLNVQSIPLLQARGVPAVTIRDLCHDAKKRLTGLGALDPPTLMNNLRQDEGLPPAKHAIDMLVAGWSKHTPELRNLLQIVENSRLKTLKQFRIPVPLAQDVVMEPDPFGVLGPGEVFLQSTLKPEGHGLVGVVKGKVVMVRSPATLLEDVVVAKAVECPRLRSFAVNRLIINVKDEVPLAKCLSGGDFDGDTAVVIWEESITQHIDALPDSDYKKLFADEEELAKKVQQPMSARQLGSEEEGSTPDPEQCWRSALHHHILGNLEAHRDLGKISEWLKQELEENGARTPEARQLGLLHRRAVDGPKHGGLLRPEGELLRHVKDLPKVPWEGDHKTRRTTTAQEKAPSALALAHEVAANVSDEAESAGNSEEEIILKHHMMERKEVKKAALNLKNMWKDEYQKVHKETKESEAYKECCQRVQEKLRNEFDAYAQRLALVQDDQSATFDAAKALAVACYAIKNKNSASNFPWGVCRELLNLVHKESKGQNVHDQARASRPLAQAPHKAAQPAAAEQEPQAPKEQTACDLVAAALASRTGARPKKRSRPSEGNTGPGPAPKGRRK